MNIPESRHQTTTSKKPWEFLIGQFTKGKPRDSFLFIMYSATCTRQARPNSFERATDVNGA